MSSRRLGPKRGASSVGSLRLAARAHDRRPAHDDRSRAAVVPDRQVAPVRQQRLRVRPEETSEIRRVLERRVEVDVVADRERKADLGVFERDEIGARANELVDARDRVLPRRAAEREKRVQCRRARRPRRGRAPPGRGRRARRGTRRAASRRRPRRRRSRLRRSSAGAFPSAWSSSTGSKKLQLPIEWKSSCRTRASSGRADVLPVPRERRRRRARTRPSRSPRAPPPLALEDHRREQVEEAVLAVRAHRVMEPGGRLEHQPSLPAPTNEPRELRVARNDCSAASHLRAQTELGDRVESRLEAVVDRHFDVDLPREPCSSARSSRYRASTASISAFSGSDASRTALTPRSVPAISPSRDAGHTSRASANE